MSEEKEPFERILILAEKSEPFEFTKEDVELYASHLGINLPEEDDLTWIAEEGLQAPLPPHWLPVEDRRGRLFYYNLETDESTWEHPSDSLYRCLVQRERQSRASSLADVAPLNSSQSSSKSSGELSEEVGILPNQALTTDDMANFRKSSRATPSRSVRFDLEQQQEQMGSTFDDFLESMDASRLSPILQKSPEPEDVNMLLQLAPRKPAENTVSSSTIVKELPVQDNKRERFLKPIELADPLIVKPMKRVEVVLVNSIGQDDVQTAVSDSFVNLSDDPRRDIFEKPVLLKTDSRQEELPVSTGDEGETRKTSGQELVPSDTKEQNKDAEKMDERDLTVLHCQHAKELEEEIKKFVAEMMELKIQQSTDLNEMKMQMETEIQTEKSRHKESLSLLIREMSVEMDEEKQKLETQMRDLRTQHTIELEHEMEKLEAERKELKSQHAAEMQEMKEQMENEIKENRFSLESQRKQELKETKFQTQEEFLKELDELKANLSKEHSKRREETVMQMKIQHEKDMEEMVQKLKKDFSANEAKILKQQHENELKKFQTELEKQLSAQKSSLQMKNEEELATLKAEYEERQREAANRIKTDSWVRQQNEVETNKFSKEGEAEMVRDWGEELSEQQFHSLLQKLELLDQRVGYLETNKNDLKNMNRCRDADDDSNQTAGTYVKSRPITPLEKAAREAWPDRNQDVISMDDLEESNSDSVSSDAYDSYLRKSFERKRSKTLRRARQFVQDRKLPGLRTNSIRLSKSVDELAARLDEEATQLALLQKKFLRKRRSAGFQGRIDDNSSNLSSQRMLDMFHSNTDAGLAQSPIGYSPFDDTMSRRPLRSAQQRMWTECVGGENAKESSVFRFQKESGDLWPNRLRHMKQKIRNSQTAMICLTRMN